MAVGVDDREVVDSREVVDGWEVVDISMSSYVILMGKTSGMRILSGIVSWKFEVWKKSDVGFWRNAAYMDLMCIYVHMYVHTLMIIMYMCCIEWVYIIMIGCDMTHD